MMIEGGSLTMPRRPTSEICLGILLIITLFPFDLYSSYVDAAKLRMCIVESSHTTKTIEKLCPRLKSDNNSPVECIVVNDRVNCLRRLHTGDAEFSILEPEELLLAGSNTEYNILVTHELRLFSNVTQRFSMVALVSSDIKSTSDLMGKRLCHGGFESSEDSTRIFAMYFQNWIIPRKCDFDKTLVENEISSLAEFFGSACVPGAWTPDSTYDNRLKSKYKNLCALCDNPAGCYNSDKYHGREGALLCLTENAADVAWVRLEDVLLHFKTLGINETNYSYLCPDGTTRIMGVGRPCVWIRKPWPVVVATRANAERVAKVVETLAERRFSWQNQVAQLMQSYHVNPVTTETLPTPDDFLWRFPGFATANTRAGCNPSRTIRWCVSSNLEDQKCRSMKSVAETYGIQPRISCIRQQNRTACLEALKTGRSDVFVVKPEEELDARLKGLASLVRAVTNKKRDMNVFAILVKNDSHYQTLEDLKGARACFTGYQSVGWNAFIDVMANSAKNEVWNCSDLRAVSDFFETSCVFGLPDPKLQHRIPSNLYSLCQSDLRGMNATAAVYACLNSGIGDVAFVGLENGLDTEQRSIPTPGKNLRSICVDASGRKEGSCLLTWTSLAAVMTNENTTELRREEIYSTLLEIDILFGKSFLGPTPAFSLYGSYDSSPDIIFPERTQHLQREADHLRLPRNYVDVVERLVNREKTYKYCSKANRPKARSYSLLASMIMSLAIVSSS